MTISQKERDLARLEHMLMEIEDLASNLHRVNPLDDWEMRAVIRCCEVIGEAANQISDETQARFPALPWSDMIAFRHKLIHGYHSVSLERIWAIATHHVNALKEPLLQAIAALQGEIDAG